MVPIIKAVIDSAALPPETGNSLPLPQYTAAVQARRYMRRRRHTAHKPCGPPSGYDRKTAFISAEGLLF
jgi:hypothetical protein